MAKVYKISVNKTEPYLNQKLGIFGLRQSVTEFQKPNYVENIVQSILLSMGSKVRNSHIAVGGDGRFFSKEAIEKVIKVCAGNQVKKLTIGQYGFMSTPAISCIVRTVRCNGAIVLSAGHNPGGPDGDFGIKYITDNGGLALAPLTEAIQQFSNEIQEYNICENLTYDLAEIGLHEYKIESDSFTIEVVDPVTRYLDMMKEIFDFSFLKCYFDSGFKPLFECMNGVAGIYVNRIFVDEFGIDPDQIMHSAPLEDFGGHQPAPNLTFASDLVVAMQENDTFDFGAAFNVDGERSMILGQCGFYVAPHDSLAIIAAHLHYMPYFRLTGVKGYARSMPTAAAIDRVAHQNGKKCYEVPPGWNYFSNLMDDGKLSICGEESFGIGSDHIRVKDGIWTALAWISVMANKSKSIEAILISHWDRFGRNLYVRHDYVDCEPDSRQKILDELQKVIDDQSLIGKEFGDPPNAYIVEVADNFEYVDPVDRSVAINQGTRIIFKCGSRIIVRISETENTKSTIRLYVDSYVKRTGMNEAVPEAFLKPLIDIALEITKIEEFTGRNSPTFTI